MSAPRSTTAQYSLLRRPSGARHRSLAVTDIPVRTSRFIPWIFVAGMLTVVAVNGALIYFATTTWSGMAINHAYDRGLAYNQVLAAAARQEALGWHVTAQLHAQSAGSELAIAARGEADIPL